MYPHQCRARESARELRGRIWNDFCKTARLDGKGHGDGRIEVSVGAAACDRSEIPAITANAQPVVMTSQPPPSALERFKRTPATTPFPSRISTNVPMNSPKSGDCMYWASPYEVSPPSPWTGLQLSSRAGTTLRGAASPCLASRYVRLTTASAGRQDL
jgi:hypothetical protein